LRDLQERDIPNIQFSHKTDSGDSVFFPLAYESDGTRKLFALAGPWLDVLAKGRILFCDELDTSLHPLMVRFLIGLVQNPEINRHNAQLIFTTHDTSVLDTELFRRDQVWFVEKDREQASRLYPLSDFKPRKGEALEKGYLNGRYGALPYIGELRF
jgi:AAA15 family ATPase/GTPase